MKRSPLKRGDKPMKRGRLPARNRKRAAVKLERNFGPPEFREWCHTQPCQFCDEAPRQHWNRDGFGHDMAHCDGRKMGGYGGARGGGDYTKVTIACPTCHDAGKPNGAFAKARETQRRWTASWQYQAYLKRVGLAA